MDIEIVLAREKYIPWIVRVWSELIEHHRDIDPRVPMIEDGSVNYEKRLKEVIGTGDSLILVAVENGRVVGFSIARVNGYPSLFVQRTYGMIEEMAVSAEYRRKGIDELILERIFEWFASQNIHTIELPVASRNQVGYSFWKKHGFTDYLHRLYLKK